MKTSPARREKFVVAAIMGTVILIALIFSGALWALNGSSILWFCIPTSAFLIAATAWALSDNQTSPAGQ